MFSPHVDNLVELGLLKSTKVVGGHGVGTQWHLDLADARIVEALRALGAAAGDGSDADQAMADSSHASAPISGLDGDSVPQGRRRGSRSAPRSRP
jgi:hypothetical protein